MLKSIIVFFLLVLTNIFFAQESIKKDSFSQAPFNRGLPDPMREFSWTEAFFADIAPGSFFEKLYLVFKDQSAYSKTGYIGIVQEDGVFRMVGISFEKNEPGQYEAEYTLQTEQEDELTPLILRIDAGKKYLFYKWAESENNVPFIVKEYPLKPGNDFPDLQIETENDDIHIEDYKGRIVVINWWATTCLPCIEEIPGLNKLVKKYEHEDILFLAILYDKENLSQFKENHNFDYLHGFSNERIFKTLGDGFPRNIILDTRGAIIYNKLGGSKNTSEQLDKIIQSLLSID